MPNRQGRDETHGQPARVALSRSVKRAPVIALDVELVVDDFGTGYSSLSYLKQLPVSTLKIDRSFITDLGNPDSCARPTFNAITTLAKALHLNVIAEGVETWEQLHALRTLRVPAAQGYYWSRPKPARDLTEWIPTTTSTLRAARPLRSA